MDLYFGIKFIDKPTPWQRLGIALIRLGCIVLGFDFEVK